MMIGLGTNFWANSLFVLPKNEIIAEFEFATPTIIKLIPIYHYAFVMLIGLTIFITIIGMWDFISFWIDNRLYFIYIMSFLFIHFERDISTN